MEMQRLMYSSDIKKTVFLSTTTSISLCWTNFRSSQNQHEPLVSMAPNKNGWEQPEQHRSRSGTETLPPLLPQNCVHSLMLDQLYQYPDKFSSWGKPLFPGRCDQRELIAMGLKDVQSIFKSTYSTFHRPGPHLTCIPAPCTCQGSLFLQSLTECTRHTILIMPQAGALPLDIPLCFLPNFIFLFCKAEKEFLDSVTTEH